MPITLHKYKFNQKVVIFIVFLFISAILWFLSALNKEYVSFLDYPVKYVNLPKNKVIANDLPKNLKLKIQAFGFTIFKQKLSRTFLPITIDVDNLPLSRINRRDSSNFFILTATIKQDISNQLGNEIRVLDVEPDSLLFNVVNILTRKVPVKTSLRLNFLRQYQLSGKIIVSPDSILAFGPHNVIDTLSCVYTNFRKTSTLSKTIEFISELRPLNKVNFSNNIIKITVPVEKFTENKIEVPLTIENLPSGLKMKTFPEKILITYYVGLSNYSRVRSRDFKLTCDYNNTSDNQSTNLRVKLIEFPTFVKIINYYPKNIDYIVEK